MPAELAAGLMRRVVPYVGQEHAKLMFEAITNPEAFAGDPYDLDYLDDEDDEDDEELEEEERPVAERGGPAPSTNGERNADPCRRATPPSTNGPPLRDKPPRPPSGKDDNGRRLPDAPRPEQRPQHGP
jgi:hypothetical protein